MQFRDDSLLLSASDLVGHLNCHHLTGLDIGVARSTLPKPAFWDPLLQILWERGTRHEQGFVNHLKAQGFDVTVIDGVGIDVGAVAQTRAAMIEGHSIIVHGAFRLNGWVGRTDILRRIETPAGRFRAVIPVTGIAFSRVSKRSVRLSCIQRLRRGGKGTNGFRWAEDETRLLSSGIY
ncbi:hypothetical protein [Agrobacterium tumefaciens]|uniref:hypothetical protein n=1 Tax=Agrobacterium tumefaciens TaxID=358 RepID=UPI001FAAA713|nr:hypothetical protein [Agrobacterium tumefaciens]UNZ53837.1 hypothetical protein MLE07_24180 [Agrobacterium tumefaciens]